MKKVIAEWEMQQYFDEYFLYLKQYFIIFFSVQLNNLICGEVKCFFKRIVWKGLENQIFSNNLYFPSVRKVHFKN